MARPTIDVTIVSDVICPWCWVGKRKLQQAAAISNDRFNVRMRTEPYLLKPDLPPEGAPKPAVTPGHPRVSAGIKAAGEEVGIDFSGKADRYPYTVPAHALLEYAESQDKQMELSEILFHAYFTDGNLLDTDSLVRLGGGVGLDPAACHHAITDPGSLERITAKARSWKHQGVAGVPCYIMNGVQTFSGSQTIEDFIKMFDVVARNYPK